MLVNQPSDETSNDTDACVIDNNCDMDNEVSNDIQEESSQNNNFNTTDTQFSNKHQLCDKESSETVQEKDQLLGLQSPSRDCRISKSKSSFLDESQAIEYLDRQLYGSNMDLGKSGCEGDVTVPQSPFVQKVENILQYVPAPPAAVQEYVSLFTKNMVSNLKTSWDRFGFVSPQEAIVYDMMSQSGSQDSLSVFSKDSSLCSSRADLSAGSHGSITKSQSTGSIRFVSKVNDVERKTSLPNTKCPHTFGMSYNNYNIYILY